MNKYANIDMNTIGKWQLVEIIKETEDMLDDNVDCSGFDWSAVATIHGAAKTALRERFGVAVGYNGVLAKI